MSFSAQERLREVQLLGVCLCVSSLARHGWTRLPNTKNPCSDAARRTPAQGGYLLFLPSISSLRLRSGDCPFDTRDWRSLETLLSSPKWFYENNCAGATSCFSSFATTLTFVHWPGIFILPPYRTDSYATLTSGWSSFVCLPDYHLFKQDLRIVL